jgi:hypothetical protein
MLNPARSTIFISTRAIQEQKKLLDWCEFVCLGAIFESGKALLHAGFSVNGKNIFSSSLIGFCW